MDSPLDEDAPAAAGVAAAALDVLSDATADSVGYPGLDSVRDLEAVLRALARLSDNLQDTARHLDDYLTGQLGQDQLAATRGSTTPAAAVQAAEDALLEVQRLSAELSGALTTAELATVQLKPR